MENSLKEYLTERVNEIEPQYIVENSEQGLYEGLLYMFENVSFLRNARNNLKNYTYDNSKIITQLEKLFMEER